MDAALFLHSAVKSQFARAGESLATDVAWELLRAVEGPDMLADGAVLSEGLKRKGFTTIKEVNQMVNSP